jgi:hypothetical protein
MALAARRCYTLVVPTPIAPAEHRSFARAVAANEIAAKEIAAKEIAAKEILRIAATALGGQGIAVMPLEGVLFQQLLYPDPTERALSDVDVLVPTADFPRAIAVLCAEGFKPVSVGRSFIEVSLASPRGLAVDLHRRLFCRARYSLSTAAVFERATRDERLLGVPIYIAHPHDTAAHLIGKFVSDHFVSEHVVDGALPRLLELARWADHCGIIPKRLARHLDASGLARAARHTLQRGVDLTDDPFFPAVLAELPRDPVGELCVSLARRLMPRLDGTWLAAAPAQLLNASLLRAGASATWTAFNRLQHARLSGAEPTDMTWARSIA